MSDYVRERLAQIHHETCLSAREKEVVAILREATRKKTKEEIEIESMARVRVGYVYFIQSGGRVKIGFSTDVINRLSNLKVGNPIGAKLVAAIPGTEDTEAYFHKMFNAYREQGEWFLIDGLLKDMLKTMPTSVTLPERKARRPKPVVFDF